ncbi:hypothetical protein HGRIS_001443 [Hohenbuehelia grisea]|uniref:Peptidase S9A N-terminal domain-containing protein n=1 Tax=Hohenbuehelia grisea TaxID=104357 RepID=A0ABR3JQP4_9AGAR
MSQPPISHPPAPRSSNLLIFRSQEKGMVAVGGPYDWLEYWSSQTAEWVEWQEQNTDEYLAKIPDRQRLVKAMMSTDYPRLTAPMLENDGRCYVTYNSGLQAQPVLYRSQTPHLPDPSDIMEKNGWEMYFEVRTSFSGSAPFINNMFRDAAAAHAGHDDH